LGHILCRPCAHKIRFRSGKAMSPGPSELVRELSIIVRSNQVEPEEVTFLSCFLPLFYFFFFF
jgi:hypothetical protein